MISLIENIAMRRVHIESKGELIALIVTVVIYFILNVALQTFKPTWTQKKINTISVIAACAVGSVIIFAQ